MRPLPGGRRRGWWGDADAGAARELLPETISLIDKAVQKGALHRNAAARYKSRLTVRANQSAK